MEDKLSVKRDDIEDVIVTFNNGVLTFEFTHSEGMDEFAVHTAGQVEEAVEFIRTWQEEAADL